MGSGSADPRARAPEQEPAAAQPPRGGQEHEQQPDEHLPDEISVFLEFPGFLKFTEFAELPEFLLALGYARVLGPGTQPYCLKVSIFDLIWAAPGPGSHSFGFQ